MDKKTAIIIGAGPAGLTAAWELLKRTDIKPVIFEIEKQAGGISRTMNFEGNLIDLGPHRFFTKSSRVWALWNEVMTLNQDFIKVPRKTRILFLNKLFDYPISLTKKTLLNLGIVRSFKIGISYILIRVKPIKPENSLADFYINRFGRELYHTFFEDYTSKVWGVPCENIPADWGAQRVKGVSIKKILTHALKNIFKIHEGKRAETSLIESFCYPSRGAGQMYEMLAKKIIDLGGQINYQSQVSGFELADEKIIAVKAINDLTKTEEVLKADYFFSTMPIKELISLIPKGIDDSIRPIAEGLIYRDYILVALVLKDFKMIETDGAGKKIIPDNWIYIQERNLKMGRLDLINNFSKDMLFNKQEYLIGAEYFCSEGDDFWIKSDQEIVDFAISELIEFNAIGKEDVIKTKVFRLKKAYPAYFGTYEKFDQIKNELNKIDNLFLIGRNGMHRYNNMDHSILTAMTAVDNVVFGRKDKENIWAVNTEQDYHEQK